MLLFGWAPCDLRVNLLVADATELPAVEHWVNERREDLQQASVSFEHARQSMIIAHKAALTSHEYASGEFVKVSTRALPVRCSTTQTA